MKITAYLHGEYTKSEWEEALSGTHPDLSDVELSTAALALYDALYEVEIEITLDKNNKPIAMRVP